MELLKINGFRKVLNTHLKSSGMNEKSCLLNIFFHAAEFVQCGGWDERGFGWIIVDIAHTAPEIPFAFDGFAIIASLKYMSDFIIFEIVINRICSGKLLDKGR